jgi:hypothetical protein
MTEILPVIFVGQIQSIEDELKRLEGIIQESIDNPENIDDK